LNNIRGLNDDADNPVTPELVEWADIIFVIEKSHRNRFSRKFNRYLNRQRVICLTIPDNFEFMDPQLVLLLKVSVPKHLGHQ
jgi:predicted protein tyrosine phosphatase